MRVNTVNEENVIYYSPLTGVISIIITPKNFFPISDKLNEFINFPITLKLAKFNNKKYTLVFPVKNHNLCVTFIPANQLTLIANSGCLKPTIPENEAAFIIISLHFILTNSQ
jgi:hypothetical protein